MTLKQASIIMPKMPYYFQTTKDEAFTVNEARCCSDDDEQVIKSRNLG